MSTWRKLIEKPINLTEEEWFTFDQVGGEAWLRRWIRNLHQNGIAKRERNRRVAREYKAGMRICDLAIKHNISRATVHRIIK